MQIMSISMDFAIKLIKKKKKRSNLPQKCQSFSTHAVSN